MSLNSNPKVRQVVTISGSDMPLIDLTPVRMRVAQERSELTLEQLDELEHRYLRFLMLCKSEPKVRRQPDKDLDQYWQAHILHTKKYAEDCKRYFGYFLHHEPNDALNRHNDKMMHHRDNAVPITQRNSAHPSTQSGGVSRNRAGLLKNLIYVLSTERGFGKLKKVVINIFRIAFLIIVKLFGLSVLIVLYGEWLYRQLKTVLGW